MNEELLESSIQTLKSVKSELQNNVENSVLETLDKAISDLETIQQNSEKFSAHDLLNILSRVLDKLPVIVEAYPYPDDHEQVTHQTIIFSEPTT